MSLQYKNEQQRVSFFALEFDFFPPSAYDKSINLKYQRTSRLDLHMKLKPGSEK